MLPHGGERGRVVRSGTLLQLETGEPWAFGMAGDFRLFELFAAAGGVPTPELEALVTDRITCGGLVEPGKGLNGHSVFGGYEGGIGSFHPNPYPYHLLRPFCEWLGRRGMRLDFIIGGDFQQWLEVQVDDGHGKQVRDDAATNALQQAHANRVVQAFIGPDGAVPWNLFEIQTCNEPSVSKNGMDVEAVIPPPAPGLLRSTGACGVDEDQRDLFHLELQDQHSAREPLKQVRSLRDLSLTRDGFDHPSGVHFAGVHVPVFAREPIGADEVPSGSRSDNPLVFGQLAALAVLHGCGAGFHSTPGVFSRLYGPVVARCAAAFAIGFRFPPPQAQLAPYQRGAADGGAGIGNMPLVHFDVEDPAHAHDGAVRTFAKLVDGVEYCVACWPLGDAWTARGRDGWTVTAELLRGLVQLGR